MCNQSARNRRKIGKSVFIKTTDKELISKIHKQLMKLNTRKMNNPIKKWSKEIDISPKNTYKWLINT